ncbi:MAG: hypothetical protein U9P88_00660 [Patescibacteria group bacterium]|nr:hypothetical protein [Patescibacteria group bacterium]
MTKNSSKQIIFPENIGLVIDGILEKYELKKIQEQGIKNFLKSKNSKEREKIFENLPASKISKLVAEYAENKTPLSKIKILLKKELGLSREKSEEMIKDLAVKIFVFFEPVKKNPKTFSEKIEKAKEKYYRKEKASLNISKNPQERDVYREPFDEKE